MKLELLLGMKTPLVLSALILLGFTPVALAVERVEFCKMGELSAPATSRLKAYLLDKQVVYIEGLLGSTRTSFVENTQAIQELDPSVPVTKLAPPPKISVQGNLAFLTSKLREAAVKNSGRKIILVGMSKGGAEVAQLAGEVPEIFSTGNAYGFLVDTVIPVNSAVGGTLLTDLELKTDPALNTRWERYKVDNHLEDGVIMSAIKRMLKYVLVDTSSDGFRSMGTAESYARSAHLVTSLSSSQERLLREKLFFVTSSRDGTDASDSPSYMSVLASFMNSEGGANDGVVFEKNQKINGFGNHLLSVSKASHFNLTGNYGPGNCRKEFTKILLSRIAERH